MAPKTNASPDMIDTHILVNMPVPDVKLPPQIKKLLKPKPRGNRMPDKIRDESRIEY